MISKQTILKMKNLIFLKKCKYVYFISMSQIFKSCKFKVN